jgi:hypothetical protein
MLLFSQALESRAGADADWSSDEGIKAACRHFQQAAGIFLHLRDKLSAGLIGTLLLCSLCVRRLYAFSNTNSLIRVSAQ